MYEGKPVWCCDSLHSEPIASASAGFRAVEGEVTVGPAWLRPI